METEYSATDTINIFVTMKALPEVTMFDWLRLVEELNYAMDQAVSSDNWDSFHIYGSSSDAFERLPQICYQARISTAALNGLREYLLKQGSWLIPVEIFIGMAVK
jgi:hypothetical protein